MHMVQYALVGPHSIFIGQTENLTDEQIRERASRIQFVPTDATIERYNRCVECEEWTTFKGKLRKNLDCPAVKGASQM
jgi:hypothetical protein